MRNLNEKPERYKVRMSWPEGSEIVIIEEGMIVNKDNLVRLNPHLKDVVNLDSILVEQLAFSVIR